MTQLETDPSAEVVARARALVPQLLSRAEETCARRRVPDENMKALRSAGALRVLQSIRNGGLGLGMRTHLEVIAALAEGCGSTAWVAGVTHAHSWLLSHFPTEAQDTVYGADPDAVVAAVIGPRGRAQRVDGGHVLSGTWPFASGNQNSTWLLLGASLVDADGSKLDDGDLLVPRDDVEMLDDWFVTGLSGTGSSTVRAMDVFVPDGRFLSMPTLVRTGRGPGADAQTDWNHRCAPVPVLALALTGAAIGIARRALADHRGLIEGKTIAYSPDLQLEHPLTHIQVGDAAMRLHEGELVLFHCADEIDQAARQARTLPLETRARMRLDCAQGVRRCREAVEILFDASGSAGLRTGGSLARAVADLRAINQHGLLNLEMNQELLGRVRLGLAPKIPML